MKEFKVLKIVDKLSFLYKKAGVDYDMFRLILNIKLTMDGRRKATVFNDTRKSKKDSNEFYKALIMYAFLGTFIGLMLIFNINKMYIMTVYFTAIMFMVLMVFISDFSYVILDVRDKNILYTKGVDSKTINAAKITHVFIYMLYLTLALVGVSFIISFKYGVGYSLIFLLEIILLDIFMIIITALAYLLVLKFFDGEKLKDIINYVQIALSIFMVVLYQIVPRFFGVIDTFNITYNEKLWHLLIPPMWFSAPLSIISGEGITLLKIIMCVLAITVPIASIIIYIKLIPSFERNLQKLNNNEDKVKEKNKLWIQINNIFCNDNTERAFFNFSLGIMNSEREFKLKIYPNLALGIVLPLIFLFPGVSSNGSEIFEGLRNSRFYLSIYAFALVIPNIIVMLRYSEKYLGAWIYEVAPIRNTSSIFRGVIKGALYKLMLGPYIIISIIFTFIFGPKVIIHLIVAFLVFILLMIINFGVFKKEFPFSKKFEATNTGESMLALMVSFGGIIMLLAIHFLISKNILLIFIYLICLIIVDLLLWKFAFNISKDKLKS
ncbi:hypothetical protein R0131_02195 [Clostridium sp. AL.422]|uniref:hypothetical protein n=1 Tax=Clostridium TaxID=1485 RepID=UPI00293DE0B3|nr:MULTISPECIES: hypothetical protein [unclassified Clostridium]MDV4149636.1 hypothetical protein [Clostridium sp. AL.422]